MSGGEMTPVERPPPLTVEERDGMIEAAVASDAGQAVCSLFVASLALDTTGVDAEEIKQGRIEAPDGGLAMARAVYDDLPEEERARLVGAATHALRQLAAEAVLQLESVALNLLEPPTEINPDTVAVLATTPIMLNGQRLVDFGQEGTSDA